MSFSGSLWGLGRSGAYAYNRDPDGCTQKAVAGCGALLFWGGMVLLAERFGWLRTVLFFVLGLALLFGLLLGWGALKEKAERDREAERERELKAFQERLKREREKRERAERDADPDSLTRAEREERETEARWERLERERAARQVEDDAWLHGL